MYLAALWLIPALASASTSEAADPAAINTVIAGLARPAPARVEFAELRFLHVMDQPLQATGELAWLGGNHLQRTLSRPVEEVVDINGDQVSMQRQGQPARHFSLRHAPPLQLLLQSFSGLLSGDVAQLQQHFTLSLHGNPKHAWSLDLIPNDQALAQQISHIGLDGRGTELRCMRVDEAHGDRSIELFGALAQDLPTGLSWAQLQQRCSAAD